MSPLYEALCDLAKARDERNAAARPVKVCPMNGTACADASEESRCGGCASVLLMRPAGAQAAGVPAPVPHLSLCASQDDTMAGYPVCDCGADYENATRTAGVETVGPRCDRCNDTGWHYADPMDPNSLEPCCEPCGVPVMREALERIAGFTLSQFMGPNDMALECVNVAQAALAADAPEGL